ncbi:radical SAM protein [Luteitalea sp.]|uniref:radical SAM protein n=1 Tax=Luteitalea sp. TaxID=2004800 RepID=UPI0025C0968E|nr:radical SAM protein [Luteitalea sp.]
MRLAAVWGDVVSSLASGVWHAAQWVNRLVPDRPFQPAWAPAPLLKQRERTSPPLGFPRETDSLCPACVIDIRDRIVAGEADWRVLVDERPGEIRASIVERDNRVYMEKTCPVHGTWSDLMAVNARFLRRIEDLYPGRDFQMAPDRLHDHGSSSIKYGRGAVLTVDLTNRCNMMCDPCFMDANQVGYVHELSFEEVRTILDDAITVKPRRQLTVQFSGGEPTLSPHFLEAIAYAKQVGYFSVQCATNGVRFAQDPEFARRARAAGLRLAYLQFDGIGNEKNAHRAVGNLFEVKEKAIEHLHAAGVDVTLVVTIVNTINNDQVGPVIRFAIDHIDKVNAVSFQPVSFTGRDEHLDADTRARWRYTLSHLAEDVQRQTGVTDPLRDWYPLSASGPLSDFTDNLSGLDAQWGSLKCGCHPNCGIGTLFLVNATTRQAVPMADVFDTDRLIEDFKTINERHRSRPVMALQAVLALLRNFRYGRAPGGLGFWQMLQVADGHTGKRMGLTSEGRHEWRVLLVAGMWFQDLFNYDFRRTEMCIIPYATQMGEISFCAYNTGVGWRKIVEKMHMNATTAEWFKTRGRHAIYAAGKSVPLPASAPRTVIPLVAVPASGEVAVPVGAGCGCHDA